MKRLVPFLLIAVVLAGTFVIFRYLKHSSPGADRSAVAPSEAGRGRSVGPGAAPPHMLGTQQAPAMIEEFGDFECPSCASLNKTLRTMKEEFGSNVVIVFRQFPIIATHKHAMAAARASEAAALQGKFWEMHNLLYVNQNEWRDTADPQANFQRYAEMIGLALDRFNQDAASDAVSQRIALDRARAYSIGVNGTPTVFLNGREVPFESLTVQRLRELIRTEISAK